MPKNPRPHADDLRAVAKLAVNATTGVTEVVQAMHTTIASGPAALGAHDDPAYRLAFPDDHQWVGYGLGHLDLLNDASVYGVLRDWIAR